MSNLWDEHTILRKKFRTNTDKDLQKKTALRTGNFESVKKVSYSNNKKLDEHNDAGKHKTIGLKRANLIKIGRNSLEDKTQKELAKKINIDIKVLQKYENGTAIIDFKILKKLEKALNLKLTGKEDTWGKNKI